MLFKKTDIKKKREADAMASHEEKCAKYLSEEVEADLNVALGEVKPDYSYHFDTGTKWSLHDIVVYLVKQIGPCNIYLSTYAIKEYQARLFSGMKADGLIEHLHCLLDYRVPVHDKDAAQLLEETCTSIGFMRTHSKLTVIESDKICAVITGSANYTTNTSADTGVITCIKSIAEYRKNWILKHIEQHETK